MKLVRLMYVSRLSKGVGPKELQDILDVSRKNNRELHVSGALCYAAHGFLQVLEGPASAVNKLYRNIVRDERHENVTLLEYVEIKQRDLEKWYMAYIHSDDIDQGILSKYSDRNVFDPFDMDARQALGFMVDIAREREAFLAQQQKALE